MEVSKSDEAGVEKTAAKIKVNHGDVKSDWSFCNDKFTMGLSGDALGMLIDHKSATKISYETKPQKGDFKAKFNFDVASSDISGVKLWENVSQKIQL